MPALNAWYILKKNSNSISKSLEKLSSGFKINRAADDAAGLAISEKMRAQIRGLSQASRNTQDGISLIQTAEGGMQEISNIMQRQRELVIQALNDTNTDDDRAKIQMEIEQLNDEIDHIAYYTEFNKIKVLCGDSSSYTVIGGGNGNGGGTLEDGVAIGPPKEVPPFFDSDLASGNFIRYFAMKMAGGDCLDVAYFDFKATSPLYTAPTFRWSFLLQHIDPSLEPVSLIFTAPNDDVFSISVDMTNTTRHENIIGLGYIAYDYFEEIDGKVSCQFWVFAGLYNDRPQVSYATPTSDRNPDYDGRWIVSVDNSANSAVLDYEFVFGGTFNSTEGRIAAGFFEYETYESGGETEEPGTSPPTIITRTEPSKLWIQSGANSGNGLWINLYDCRIKTFGIDEINVLTAGKANEALEAIDKAIVIVSSYRATAGAQQNRLEYTLTYLGISEENLINSESRIRDADMAKEMMELVKNNILTNAAQAMLAQANKSPEMALYLLK